MYSSKDTYTWMDPRAHTHANWPHLDLLLQEVDFVLLLQKLLLLPGNLRDRAHHNTLLECLCSVCVCTCARVCFGVCAGPVGDATHLQVSQAPVARQRVDALV